MFYDIFEALCQEKNITPSQVRKDLSISQSTMASWKSRGLAPNAITLVQIADYFNTTPAYLMGNKLAKNPIVLRFNASPDPEWEALEQKLEAGTITPDELLRYKNFLVQSTANMKKMVSTSLEQLVSYMELLNPAGQQVALERIEELTEMPKYQRKKHLGNDNAPLPENKNK